MRIASLVSKWLVAGDFSNYFSKVPSVLECAEPIVLAEGAFVRDSRIDGEERGAVAVSAMVVREVAADAEAVAIACEQWVRSFDWERDRDAWPLRVVGVDTTAPCFKERDSMAPRGG